MSDESRERFEKWAKGPKLPLKRDGRLYTEYMTELAWLAWQFAERDTREQCAQVIEKYADTSRLEDVQDINSLAERVRGKGAQ